MKFKILMRIFFTNNGREVEIKNELINFILPLEDLEDIATNSGNEK